MKFFQKIWPIGILFLAILFISGCDNKKNSDSVYQLMESEDGRLYRLNKETGQIVLLEGNKIVPLEVERRKKIDLPPKSMEANSIIEDTPQDLKQTGSDLQEKIIAVVTPSRQLKQWHDEQLSGKNLKVSFQSSWENNKLFFILEALPYSSLKRMMDKKEEDIYYQRKWHGFIVKLIDNNNDTVKVIPVKLWDMARTLGEKGRFASLKIESKVDLLEDEFIRITGYKIEWKLDNILIPEYKFKNKVDDLIGTYSWYGEVDTRVDTTAPDGAKYWWMIFPDKKKIYFSTEDELLKSYQETVEKILEKGR